MVSRYVIVKDGIADNVVVATEKLESHWIESNTAGVGDIWDGTTFTRPDNTPSLAERRANMKVSMRQARLALLSEGLLSSVDTIIASLSEPAKTNISIEWEYASVVDRNSPWMGQMATALGLSDMQLDSLFELAGTL